MPQAANINNTRQENKLNLATVQAGGQFGWLRHLPQPHKMSKAGFRAAILVVSTTASRDPSADSSVESLTDVLDKGDGKWKVADSKIVSDEV